jgi:hypothetical protein
VDLLWKGNPFSGRHFEQTTSHLCFGEPSAAKAAAVGLNSGICYVPPRSSPGGKSSAESHDRAGSIEPACHARLADLTCIRPSVNNSHFEGSCEPSVWCAARLPGTACIHLHSSVRECCRHNGRATGLDNPTWDSCSLDEGLHEACSCRARCFKTRHESGRQGQCGTAFFNPEG